ncbi:MAG: beta galactosidase jelly roll domain-containing protein [Chloroflexi bacterium]|nr:beta galactosidase jelly roll domain-containing protein [Chloroflexota bacterium]MCC6895870.1 beta galactosidase jelly roll domain-containing protein [Anaerolineae bacterium]
MRLLILITLLLSFAVVSAAPEQNAQENTDIPRPEYPRPDFQRDNWLNLNGTWDFAFDTGNVGVEQNWFDADSEAFQDSILVPFPWQSILSGIADPPQYGVAWYRRVFTVPEGWDEQQTVLHLGAVDYWARVWVNGTLAGEHEGGYTPFEFDITEMLIAGENSVVVRVEDPADLAEIPHGKQSSTPPNPWDDVDFTTVSGIWQTVWLEARPTTHIAQVHITPDVPNESAMFAVTIESPTSETLELQIDVRTPDGQTLAQSQELVLDEANTRQTFTINMDVNDPLLWEPETPHLYEVDLTLKATGNTPDVLHTYFGMRRIEVSGNNVLLNGHPVYLRSALVQGYWPDGLYTAPSDAAFQTDINLAKQFGFNGLRMHLKIEDPRWVYWADKLGMLLWNDVPCPVDFTPLAQERLTNDLQAMIERDYNHPSIVIWGPYNESWGLEFRSQSDIQIYLSDLYDQIKAWDPTRLVVDNSGWRHVKTDIADSHKYTANAFEWSDYLTQLETAPMSVNVLGHPFYAEGQQYSGEPLMVSEYGTGWGEERPIDFQWQTVEIRRHGGLVGYTYTELYDVEHELGGLARYDRTIKEVTFDYATVNSADFVGLDYQGNVIVKTEQVIEVPIFVSLYGQPALSKAVVEWRLERITGEAGILETGSYGTLTLTPYSVNHLEPLVITMPKDKGSVRLTVEVRDADGTLRAFNTLALGAF